MSLMKLNDHEVDRALRDTMGESGNLRYDSRRKTLIILGLAAACLLEAVALAALARKEAPPPHFFAVTPDGRQYQLISSGTPVMNEQQAGQWLSYALSQILNYNWTELDPHFADAASKYFTEDSWLNFKNELNEAGTFQSVQNNELISNMKLTSSPILVHKGQQAGVDAWEFEAKGTLSYLNRTQRSDNQMKFRVVVGLVQVGGTRDFRILALYMSKDRV
ncbi:DotI/IcmL family type IV secretion protein [Chromobacterium sp. CV08]|uniref:DotI/IcmL family type IV secretion protein n=1 Tax=Chromobacterium sp. CV08 TaxID=3133274 RepID=UPI003DA91A5B